MASLPEENEMLQKGAEWINRSIRRCFLNKGDGKIPKHIIVCRVKTKYSQKRKTGIKGSVLDKYAYTIICENEEMCNSILEGLKSDPTCKVVYNNGKSTEKNYINAPKETGYKSIHVGLELENGMIIEVHIETPQLYKNNNFNKKTSHEAYKTTGIDYKKSGLKKVDAQTVLDLFFSGDGFKSTKEISDTINGLANAYYSHYGTSVDIYNVIEELAIKSLGVNLLKLVEKYESLENNNGENYMNFEGILEYIQEMATFEKIARVIIDENGNINATRKRLYENVFFSNVSNYQQNLKEYIRYVYGDNVRITPKDNLLKIAVAGTLPELKVVGENGNLMEVRNKYEIMTKIMEEFGFIGLGDFTGNYEGGLNSDDSGTQGL